MNTTAIASPWPSRLLSDCLADAEREVLKLRQLLVLKLCDCRPMAITLPLEPVMHAPRCTYRRSLDE